MPKCDKCGGTFKGFGTTCSNCRKNGKNAGIPKACEQCGTYFVGPGPMCIDCASGRGVGRTGVKLPTPEEVDKVLDKMETSLKKVDVSQDSMVKLRKAEFDLLGQMEQVRDLMERVLKSGDRKLLKTCLGNAGRIARLRTFLDSVHLSDMNAKDQRFRLCDNVCTSVQDMLSSDMGLAQEFEEAKQEQDSKLLLSRLSIVMDDKKKEEFAINVSEGDMRKYGGELRVTDGQQKWHDPLDDLVDSDYEDDWEEEEEDWDEVMQFEIFEQNVRRLFDELDADGNGKLTKEEVKNAAPGLAGVLKACRIFKRKHIVKLFREGDMDGDGTLDFDEFLSYIVSAQEQAYYSKIPKLDDKAVAMIFQTMDKDGDGTITQEELKFAYAGILLRSGEAVDPKRVSKWAKRNFKKYDKDGSNALDINEFKLLIQNSGALAPMVEAAKAARMQG